MKLYDAIACGMLRMLNQTTTGTSTTAGGGIGVNGCIDFFTNTTALNGGTGMMKTTQRVLFSSTPVGTFTADATNPDAYTACTAVFAAMTTGVVETTGTVAYFAILNTTGATTQAGQVLTGTVGVSGSNINFNVTAWDAGDNISITSLTFTQPK